MAYCTLLHAFNRVSEALHWFNGARSFATYPSHICEPKPVELGAKCHKRLWASELSVRGAAGKDPTGARSDEGTRLHRTLMEQGLATSVSTEVELSESPRVHESAELVCRSSTRPTSS
jgi:hypothetical protein